MDRLRRSKDSTCRGISLGVLALSCLFQLSCGDSAAGLQVIDIPPYWTVRVSQEIKVRIVRGESDSILVGLNDGSDVRHTISTPAAKVLFSCDSEYLECSLINEPSTKNILVGEYAQWRFKGSPKKAGNTTVEVTIQHLNNQGGMILEEPTIRKEITISEPLVPIIVNYFQTNLLTILPIILTFIGFIGGLGWFRFRKRKRKAGFRASSENE